MDKPKHSESRTCFQDLALCCWSVRAAQQSTAEAGAVIPTLLQQLGELHSLCFVSADLPYQLCQLI